MEAVLLEVLRLEHNVGSVIGTGGAHVLLTEAVNLLLDGSGGLSHHCQSLELHIFARARKE